MQKPTHPTIPACLYFSDSLSSYIEPCCSYLQKNLSLFCDPRRLHSPTSFVPTINAAAVIPQLLFRSQFLQELLQMFSPSVCSAKLPFLRAATFFSSFLIPVKGAPPPCSSAEEFFDKWVDQALDPNDFPVSIIFHTSTCLYTRDWNVRRCEESRKPPCSLFSSSIMHPLPFLRPNADTEAFPFCELLPGRRGVNHCHTGKKRKPKGPVINGHQGAQAKVCMRNLLMTSMGVYAHTHHGGVCTHTRASRTLESYMGELAQSRQA
jgi:hypothetical protein